MRTLVTLVTLVSISPWFGACGGGGVDVAGFCERTMKAANPDQCYGRDARAEGLKRSMCTELLGGALSAGHISIDPAGLAACEKAALAGLARLSNQRGINDLAEAFPECRDVVKGKLGAGQECLGTMACAPGLMCSGMKCQPVKKEGESCRQHIELSMVFTGKSDCAAGLYCDLGDRVCRPRLAAAAACKSSDACQDGHRCRGGVCVAAAPSKAGEECDRGDCPAGHYCTLFERRCEPLKPDGEPCTSNTECQHTCVPKGDSYSGACGPC